MRTATPEVHQTVPGQTCSARSRHGHVVHTDPSTAQGVNAHVANVQLLPGGSGKSRIVAACLLPPTGLNKSPEIPTANRREEK